MPNPTPSLPRRRDLALLLVLGLVVIGLAARAITHPGYVDAYYYFGGARQLARGAGFTELYQWNYLAVGQRGMTTTPPWPSHLYWMPLTSIISAPFMAAAERLVGTAFSNAALFRAAQVPMVLAASLLPLISYVVAWRLARVRRHAWAAALLTLFSPFYFIYWANTDAFALHGVAAAGALLAITLVGQASRRRRAWALVAGLSAGAAHLARADGVLVVLVVMGWVTWLQLRRRLPLAEALVLLTLVVAGYLVVMAPWFARNLLVVGAPLAAGGAQTLWLREYNELFNYPGGHLTPAHYFSTGWTTLLLGKWEALRTNATTLAVVQGGVVAFPFTLLGLWRCRRVPLIQISLLYGLALFGVMTFAFTWPGARGGYFHSGAALLPVFSAVALIGLEAGVEALSRRLRHWQPMKSIPIFTALLVLGTITLALVVFAARVIGPDPSRLAWDRQDAVYAEAGAWMAANQAAPGVVVANNPPGWSYWTGQPAIVIPNGAAPVLLRVMDDYDARWLVLDQNYPAGLAGLYAQPESEPRLTLRARFGEPGAQPVYLLEREAAP